MARSRDPLQSIKRNISGPEKWVENPLTHFQIPVPVPVLMQCEEFCILYSNPLLPVPVPFPVPVPVQYSVNVP